MAETQKTLENNYIPMAARKSQAEALTRNKCENVHFSLGSGVGLPVGLLMSSWAKVELSTKNEKAH